MMRRRTYNSHLLSAQLVQWYPLYSAYYTQRKTPNCPISSGLSKLYTGSLKCTRIKRDLLLVLVLAKEEEAYFCSTQQINTHNEHCLLFPTTIHKANTTGCAKHNRQKEYSLSQWI